jgi:hypothetical protein
MSGAGVVQNPVLAQGARCIIDPPATKGYLLMAAQIKAMVIDFDKAKAQRLTLPGVPGAGAPGTPVLTEPPKVEKTGQKEVVAGYTCELWKVSAKNAHADVRSQRGSDGSISPTSGWRPPR